MVTVRKATKEDIEDLTVIFDLYRVWYHQPSDIAAARKFLLQRMEKEESMLLVAVQGDALVGFTQLYPIFSSISLQRTWLLNDLPPGSAGSSSHRYSSGKPRPPHSSSASAAARKSETHPSLSALTSPSS